MRRTTHFLQFALPDQPSVQFEPLGNATLAGVTPNSARYMVGRTTVEVTALADDLFRVGMFPEGRPIDYRSEAIARTDWPSTQARASEDGTNVATPQAAASVSLAPLRISFQDTDGRAFAVDDPRLGAGFAPLAPAESRLVDPLGPPSRVYKRHIPGTRYFGCGERTGGLDKTGAYQVFWNVDPPSGHTAALNNLYTSVPFVMALENGQAWGMFVDSSYRLEFDLAAEDRERCGFAIDGGPLVYYVFAGPTPRAVLERYTELTGRIPLPPRWALGNQQSRWGYKSADEMLELARTFRARGIPLDVVYLDIDYMDGYRVFTWDAERFPDPKALTQALEDIGVKLITIVDPGVKVDEEYAVYRSGREGDLFCKTFLGNEYRNVVWPGTCAFPDFTSTRTRAWWADHLPVLLDAGVAGIWCDMNEPTVFVPTPQTLPEDVTHHGDGDAQLHAQVHNLYGQLMARATYEGLRKFRPDRRPVVISRSGYAGLQRYAIHWTGDNSSWWEHLRMCMPQLLNLGLSGYAWVGVDIGGFAGDATAELLTRWTELGIFQPFCRNHSAWDTRRQEPWAFGEPYESHMRELLLLRQRLLPYLYTLFEEAQRTGAPILRPLLFEYPDDETTYSADDELLLGSALLIAPIAQPGIEHRHAYVPRGTWVQYWTGERVDGPAHVLAHAPLGRPAIYVRANTPVPMWPAMEYTSQREPDPLTWLVCVAPDGEGSGVVYDDAGEGYAFEAGEFSRLTATCRASASEVELQLGAQTGHWMPPHRTVELDIRGIAQPRRVEVNGVEASQAEALEWDSHPRRAEWTQADGRLLIRMPASRDATAVTITL